MLPAIVSQLVVLLKDTALGFLIVYDELLDQGKDLFDDFQFQRPVIPVSIVIAVIYIACARCCRCSRGCSTVICADHRRPPTSPPRRRTSSRCSAPPTDRRAGARSAIEPA